LSRSHPSLTFFPAIQDANLPKFLSHDVPLFLGILSDLFPTISPPEVDYGSLNSALQQTAASAGLQVRPCMRPLLHWRSCRPPPPIPPPLPACAVFCVRKQPCTLVQ
jgi:hypothetical protein